MMNALAGWLKQIVAVVLLASLIDLLLPNRTMQRYVRLVAGLFILLTVATPMLQWIKGDFGTKLAAGIDAAERQPDQAAGQLAQIEAEAGRLRISQENQAARIAAVRLEGQIRDAVEQEAGAAVDKVSVELSRLADGGAQLTGVTIQLRAGSEAADAGKRSGGAIGDVAPVAPVTVEVPDISVQPSASPKDADPAASASPAPAEADRAEQNRIAAVVASRFGVSTNAIRVITPAPGDPY
ncbi:stage III sporulation protein AF [Cohnella nanjingensis]|uniref:Stage III sporulation protein AF n=1 Tax=Cohnella nanjingensis TaxID=1387779 RepID=A0A7X0RZB5_9BACL|nr:stage III sporulation protein AF [Cohnella nanjingensis]MBB6675241.1 stage III sporulation protein AF [Cohnella nanjingensis]